MGILFTNVSSSSLVATVTYNNESFIANINAGTALIKTGNGIIKGLTVNSHSSGIVDIYDGTTFAVANIMHSSLTFATGQQNIDLRDERFATGLFINVLGTANITVQYN